MTSPARTGPGRARRAGRRHGEPLDGRYVDRLAGEHAGGALRVNGDLAVHHHERNADWELARIVIGGSVDDSLGIEHDPGRRSNPREAPPTTQAKASRGAFGHPVDHRLKREPADLASETRQEPAEGAVRTGVREAARRGDVAANHVVGPGEQRHAVWVTCCQSATLRGGAATCPSTSFSESRSSQRTSRAAPSGHQVDQAHSFQRLVRPRVRANELG